MTKLISFRRLLFSLFWLGVGAWCTPGNAWGAEYPTAISSGNDAMSGALSSSEQGTALSLTLQQSFEMGLKNSSAVKRVRFQPLQAAEEYNKAKSIYDPVLFSVGSAERTDRPIQSSLEGDSFSSALIEDRWQVQAGIKERLPTGGSIALYQEAGRYDTNNHYTIPNPQYQTRIMATLSQPLLKGRGDQEGAAAIQVASLNLQIAESAFKRDVTDVLMEISQNYWQLYLEQNIVRITRNSLARAQEVYNREKNREKQGLSMPVDVDRALVAVKTRRGSLLRARNQERLSIRKLWLLLAPERMFTHTDLPDLVVQDLPKMEFDSWDRRKLQDEALSLRQEMAIARKTVAVSERQHGLAAHNKLPQLDLKFNYGFSGLNDKQDNLLGDPYNNNYNNWRVELVFELPLGGRSAEAEKSKAFYKLQQSRAEMALTKERITQDMSVILDELFLAEEELQVTKKAMEAAARVLKGEEALFELGKKNNRDLLEGQNNYDVTEKEHLQAQARYNLNLVSLARAKGTLLNDYGLNVEALLTAAQNK
jgi:outer membrane protein TolC